MIKLMFVKSNAPLSKLIMWSTSEPVSHFAIGITLNNKATDYLVFNSDLYGVRVLWSTDFLKSHKIVYEIDYDLDDVQTNDFTQKVIDRSIGSPYNFIELVSCGLLALYSKISKKPTPKTSWFGREDEFMCTDLARLLPQSMTHDQPIEVHEVLTPYQLYQRLKK